MTNQLSHEQEERERHRTNQLFSSHPIYERNRAISRLYEIARANQVFSTIGIRLRQDIKLQLFVRHWWKLTDDLDYYYKWHFFIVDHFNQEKTQNIVHFMQKYEDHWENLFQYLQSEITAAVLSDSIEWLQSNVLKRSSLPDDISVLHHHLLVIYSGIPHTGIMLADIWEDFYRKGENEGFLRECGSPPAFLVKVEKANSSSDSDPQLPPIKYRPLVRSPEDRSDYSFRYYPQSEASYYNAPPKSAIEKSLRLLFQEYLYPLFYDEKFPGDRFTKTVEVQANLDITGYLFFPIYEFHVQNKLYGAHLGWVQLIIGGSGENNEVDAFQFSFDEPNSGVIDALFTACESFQFHINECLTSCLLRGIETDILKEELIANSSARDFLANNVYLLGGWTCNDNSTNTALHDENEKPAKISNDGNLFIDLTYEWPSISDKRRYFEPSVLTLKKKNGTLLPAFSPNPKGLVEHIESILYERLLGFHNRIRLIIDRLAAQKLNIGHRFPGIIDSIVMQLYSSEHSEDIPVPPQVQMLSLASALQQDSTPPWSQYVEMGRVDERSIEINKNVIQNIWLAISAPVGEANVKMSKSFSGLIQYYKGAKRPYLDIIATSFPTFRKSTDFRVILTLMVILLTEAYGHTLLSSMRSLGLKRNDNAKHFDPKVEIRCSSNEFSIRNPIEVESPTEVKSILNHFNLGNQFKELETTRSLANYYLELKATYPSLEKISAGFWVIAYNWRL